jgi:hypothetical protein
MDGGYPWVIITCVRGTAAKILYACVRDIAVRIYYPVPTTVGIVTYKVLTTPTQGTT